MHNQMRSFSTDENYKNQMEVVEIKNGNRNEDSLQRAPQ